jgi:ribosomal protein S12 methylthiotransferase accessory factor
MTVAVAAPAPRGSKEFFRGTHRACPPEQTWERIRPLLAIAGITRVGELTRLDGVGIPVAQAVRPASRTAAVTLGAGLTAVHARVSAAMASLERRHAERVEAPSSWSAVAAVRANLGYNPYTLPLHTPHLLNDGMVLDWVPATILRSGRPTLVPRACAEHDLTVRDEWSPPVFLSSADGLAAGNTHAEAVLHALYEVLAREAAARVRALPREQRVAVEVASVDSDDARRLLDRLAAAGLRVSVTDITGPGGVPGFEVVAASEQPRIVARGAACHLDPAVALCRALAAAARERMAAVTGARDDIPVAPGLPDGHGAGGAGDSPQRRDWASFRSLSTSSFAGDVAELSDRIHASGAGPVLVVDLSRESVGLPVVRVIVAGMRQTGVG